MQYTFELSSFSNLIFFDKHKVNAVNRTVLLFANRAHIKIYFYVFVHKCYHCICAVLWRNNANFYFFYFCFSSNRINFVMSMFYKYLYFVTEFWTSLKLVKMQFIILFGYERTKWVFFKAQFFNKTNLKTFFIYRFSQKFCSWISFRRSNKYV